MFLEAPNHRVVSPGSPQLWFLSQNVGRVVMGQQHRIRPQPVTPQFTHVFTSICLFTLHSSQGLPQCQSFLDLGQNPFPGPGLLNSTSLTFTCMSLSQMLSTNKSLMEATDGGLWGRMEQRSFTFPKVFLNLRPFLDINWILLWIGWLSKSQIQSFYTLKYLSGALTL